MCNSHGNETEKQLLRCSITQGKEWMCDYYVWCSLSLQRTHNSDIWDTQSPARRYYIHIHQWSLTSQWVYLVQASLAGMLFLWKWLINEPKKNLLEHIKTSLSIAASISSSNFIWRIPWYTIKIISCLKSFLEKSFPTPNHGIDIILRVKWNISTISNTCMMWGFCQLVLHWYNYVPYKLKLFLLSKTTFLLTGNLFFCELVCLTTHKTNPINQKAKNTHGSKW